MVDFSDHYRLFTKTVRLGIVSKAAQRLEIALTTTSDAIHLLEVSTEVRLLDRKTWCSKYNERREIKLGYREIKQNLLKGEQLRSKQPDPVRQELWGTLFAYNLIRQKMRLIAGEIKVAPQRLSFLCLSQAVTNGLRLYPLETPATISKRLAELQS